MWYNKRAFMYSKSKGYQKDFKYLLRDMYFGYCVGCVSTSNSNFNVSDFLTATNEH